MVKSIFMLLVDQLFGFPFVTPYMLSGLSIYLFMYFFSGKGVCAGRERESFGTLGDWN